MKPEYQIIDQILDLKAQLAGKRLELAMSRVTELQHVTTCAP